MFYWDQYTKPIKCFSSSLMQRWSPCCYFWCYKITPIFFVLSIHRDKLIDCTAWERTFLKIKLAHSEKNSLAKNYLYARWCKRNFTLVKLFTRLYYCRIPIIFALMSGAVGVNKINAAGVIIKIVNPQVLLRLFHDLVNPLVCLENGRQEIRREAKKQEKERKKGRWGEF